MIASENLGGWLKKSISQIWYSQQIVSLIWAWFFLLPTLIFCSMVTIRRYWYRKRALRVNVPIVVVGNISVGGSGKTPMVIYLVQQLKRIGFDPGVITRGYASKESKARCVVGNDYYSFGDEAVLIANRADCPVAVGHDRWQVAKMLLANNKCNIIICDDGLQHYRLHRDMEIIVVDGNRGFGNGYCLPSGPLREKTKRLDDADFVIDMGRHVDSKHGLFTLQPLQFVNLESGNCKKLDYFSGQRVHAVAGIAHPDRFFRQLEQLGLNLIKHYFPDHHSFKAEELCFNQLLPIIMTEKDAVKCGSLASSLFWYLKVAVEIEEHYSNKIFEKINLLMTKES